MKVQKLILSILIVSCLSSYGQTTDVIIKKTRSDFKMINSDTTLKKITLEDEEFSEHATDGGGELTGYFRNNSLLKIVEWIGLSYGNRTREFYLKNNNLFFVFEKFEAFLETDSGLDHLKVKTIFAGRYYFNNGKLISEKTSGENKLADKTSAQDLLDQTKDYIKLLNKKKS